MKKEETMSNLQKFKPHIHIPYLNKIGGSLIAVYVVAMFIVPTLQTMPNWNALQDVWDRWQGLNVGMLAFIASIIAFNISAYNAEQERKRNFVATRAFLPEAFSDLISYCYQSISVLDEAWQRTRNDSDRCRTPLETPIPSLPNSYRPVFQDCIKTASPEVGERLAYILTKLQIHNSRMQSLGEEFHPNSRVSIAPHNVITYLYAIAKIHALICQLYEFARGEEDFEEASLTLKNYQTAFSLSDTGISYRSEFQELVDFIQNIINRENDNA